MLSWSCTQSYIEFICNKIYAEPPDPDPAENCTNCHQGKNQQVRWAASLTQKSEIRDFGVSCTATHKYHFNFTQHSSAVNTNTMQRLSVLNLWLWNCHELWLNRQPHATFSLTYNCIHQIALNLPLSLKIFIFMLYMFQIKCMWFPTAKSHLKIIKLSPRHRWLAVFLWLCNLFEALHTDVVSSHRLIRTVSQNLLHLNSIQQIASGDDHKFPNFLSFYVNCWISWCFGILEILRSLTLCGESMTMNPRPKQAASESYQIAE